MIFKRYSVISLNDFIFTFKSRKKFHVQTERKKLGEVSSVRNIEEKKPMEILNRRFDAPIT